MERAADHTVIGGAVLLSCRPDNEDWETGRQLHPGKWGQGYAGECTFALARWAFSHGLDEVFTVVRPNKTRIARNGVHWVGETRRCFDLDLQVFRLRPAGLGRTAHGTTPDRPSSRAPGTAARARPRPTGPAAPAAGPPDG